MAKWNPKTTPDLITPTNIQEDLLRQETLAGSGQTGSGYRAPSPDPMLQANYENFLRRYESSLFRQAQVNLLPSVTRDIEAKASRAKTPKELDKVIKDTIAVQTKYLNDLLTDINNRANTLGTMAQIKMDKELAKQTSADPQTLQFYQEKIDEVKSIEASLRTYAETVTKKLTSKVTTAATTTFKKASLERQQIQEKKVRVEEARIVSKYQSQFEKTVKQELDLVAKRTAYEQAQQFINKETARGVDPKQVMAEARKVYDATREEVLTKTKVESKLPREEVLARYEEQNKQFGKFDFVSEITQMPAFVNEARKFEIEFRTGLVKSGQEILDYFAKVGQTVPQDLEKQLKKPTFTAESGTVFASGITDKNRETVTKQLQETFQKASEPGPYTPPSMEPKPTYIDVLRQRVPTGFQKIAELLTTTAQERAAQQAKSQAQPTPTPNQPPGQPPVPPNYNKSSLTLPPGGNGGGGGGLDDITNLTTRLSLLRSRLKMLGDAVTVVTAIPKQVLAATAEATTAQGIEPAQATGAFAKGLKTATGAAGSLGGAAAGGAIGGAIGSVIPGAGTAAGMVLGSAIGGGIGTAAGGMLADPIPILTKIADNTAKSVEAFSPQVLTTRLDGQLEMLRLSISTADKYGSELAELQIYSNSVRQEMYKLGVEFLIAFKPFIEDMTALVIYIVTSLTSMMKWLYFMYEVALKIVPVLGPLRIAAMAAGDWFEKSKKDTPKSGPMDRDISVNALMENRPRKIVER